MKGLDPQFYGAALNQWRKAQPAKVRPSHQKIADQLGLERTTISNVFRGIGKLTYERFIDICRAMGASVPEVYQAGTQLELEWLLSQAQSAGREQPSEDLTPEERIRDLEERGVEGFRQIFSALLEAQTLRNRS